LGIQHVLGIIVEYNPFHNGHLHHIRSAKEVCKAQGVVAIMSGPFVQRGEPAIMDWLYRTKIALHAGVNLVILLPGIFSNQDAGGFAFGSVSLLHHTGIVTDLVFGSESANLADLHKVSNVLTTQPDSYRAVLHTYLKRGFSFPNARKHALHDYFKADTDFHKRLLSLLSKSNDILGLEYLNALRVLNSSIRPNVISRIGSEDTDPLFRGAYSSATAIRNLIHEFLRSNDPLQLAQARETMPDFAWELLYREICEGQILSLDEIGSFFLFFLRGRNREHIQHYQGVEEGLDVRLVQSAYQAETVSDLLQKAKSKRFTHSRLRRTVINFLFEISSDMIRAANQKGPQYLRVLGFDPIGQQMLSKMRQKASLPIIVTPSLYAKAFRQFEKKVRKQRIREGKEETREIDYGQYCGQFELDLRMADFYRVWNHPGNRLREMQIPPVMVRF